MFSFRRLLRRRVIVSLKTGRGFVGILYSKRGPLVALRNATMIDPDGRRTPTDGEVVIERSMIEFYEIAPAPQEAS